MGKTKKRKLNTRKYSALLLGAYVPAFINIHFRYARHNFKAWVALFVAPFLTVKLFLARLFNLMPEDIKGVWHLDLIAIFVISICFYLAERFDNVRRIYVWAVPFVIFFSLIYWAHGQGSSETTGLLVKFGLITYFSYRVGKFTTTTGYEQLDDGADADYHAGKEFYDAADYDQALPHLEESAKRGHFKSQYLLGDAYEKGHHYDCDLAKAAIYYHKASQKGYRTATLRHDAIIDTLSPEQKLEYDTQLRETMFKTS